MHFNIILLASILISKCSSKIIEPGVIRIPIYTYTEEEKIEMSNRYRRLCGDTEECNSANNLKGSMDNFLGPRDVKLKLVDLKSPMFWGIIYVGTGKSQSFKVTFDTGSPQFWLPSSKCSDDCACLTHSRYNSSNSATHETGGRNYSIIYKTGEISGFTSKDNVHIADDLIIRGQEFIEATVIKHEVLTGAQFDGIFGLGYKDDDYPTIDTPLTNMWKQKLIRNNMFSVYFNRSETKPLVGMIIFGEVDINLYNGFTWWHPIHPLSEYWLITMDLGYISFSRDPKKTDKRFCENTCKTVVDTGSNVFSVPKDIAKSMNDAINATENWGGGLMRVDCNSYHSLPYIYLMFGIKNYVIYPKDYVSKVNHRGKNICISTFIAHDANFWILGIPFFKRYYTVFDIGRKKVGFAEARK